jgi:primase-polymerase (primpol)-like protein
MTDINVDTIPGGLKERDQWLLWDDGNGWDLHKAAKNTQPDDLELGDD